MMRNCRKVTINRDKEQRAPSDPDNQPLKTPPSPFPSPLIEKPLSPTDVTLWRHINLRALSRQISLPLSRPRGAKGEPLLRLLLSARCFTCKFYPLFNFIRISKFDRSSLVLLNFLATSALNWSQVVFISTSGLN